jgi:hypothetical protein
MVYLWTEGVHVKKVFAVRTPSIKSSILIGTLVGAGRGREGRELILESGSFFEEF